MNDFFNVSGLRVDEHRAELLGPAERHRQARGASPRATRPRRHPAAAPSTERPPHPMHLGVMSTATPGLRQLTPLASLLLLAAAAWLGVIVVARRTGPMPGTMGLGIGPFTAVWALMMTAMMLPSVTPFASLYTRRLTEHRGSRLVAFGSGYLLVWSMAAIPAYALAWLVDRFVSGHPSLGTGLAVAIFAGCGFYQLTPLKDRCLARCRSPLGFVFKFGTYNGPTRDLRVGLYHGGFCLACCWGLMTLLVVFGLMNLAYMVVLSAVILGEKSFTRGWQFSRVLGVIALSLAVLVVFVPGVAPGLHTSPTPHPGMERM
jgi:predicted metal-binding membrane protein